MRSPAGRGCGVGDSDTYGGLYHQARQLISHLIKPLVATNGHGSAAKAGAKVWSAISTAVMPRAGSQLARHSKALDQLAWTPAGQPDEEDSGTEEDATGSHLALGINPSQHGRGNQLAVSAGLEPPPEVDEMQADSATSVSEGLLRVCVRLLSGAVLSCTADRPKPVGELKAAVLHHCGLPPESAESFGLSLGFAALRVAPPPAAGGRA